MPNPQFAVELATATLARSPLFEGLEPEELARLAEAMGRRRYRRNEVIFHEGDPGDALHVVLTGRVKIARESPEGEEAIVVMLAPGDAFGELVLLVAAPRSAAAGATPPTGTVSLPRAAFAELVDAGGAFPWRLLGCIAVRIRRLTDQLAEVHFLDLAGRLALQLSRLAEESAPGRGADIELAPTLTQSDLASMVGGTRQRVNQILRDFTDEGLVGHEAGHLVIRDLDRLRERARW